MRTYSELITFPTFDERFAYLSLKGVPGAETFGHERWLNQRFYQSKEWSDIRTEVIARDLGYDLGVPGYAILKIAQVHHMNPMRPKDIIHFNPDILNPEFLISVTHSTHNAIHYGVDVIRPPTLVERTPNDTTPWKEAAHVRDHLRSRR